MTHNDLKTQQNMDNIEVWAANNAINLINVIYKNQSSRQSKLTKDYMKTSKRAREARKKLAKDPARKKRTGNLGRARRPAPGLCIQA